MTRRIRNPRYGMMVTDTTGLWMLVAPRQYVVLLGRLPTADEHLVWWAWNIRMNVPNLLLLDDQFGEVE